jgi:hypothetical protein
VTAGAAAGIGLANITNSPTPPLTCSGAVGNIVCSSTGEGRDTGTAGARTVTASIQLEDAFGNAVNNTGGNVSIALSVAGNGTVSNATLTIPSGQSVSSTTFSLVRASGTGRTVTMTAKVGGTTELTITLSS